MRGTAWLFLMPCIFERITPARAGNSDASSRSFAKPEDHPRACGEQYPYPRTCLQNIGSPPRVRGTVFRILRFDFRERITPARAGNRPPGGPCGLAAADHPRACGEQLTQRQTGASSVGSPPRVRGTAVEVDGAAGPAGITPARAGNSGGLDSDVAQQMDHPRACGEQRQLRCYAGPGGGSPPRVRGTAVLPNPFAPLSGITPARAGNRRRPG